MTFKAMYSSDSSSSSMQPRFVAVKYYLICVLPYLTSMLLFLFLTKMYAGFVVNRPVTDI